MGSPSFPWLGRKGGPPTLTKKNGEGGLSLYPGRGNWAFLLPS